MADGSKGEKAGAPAPDDAEAGRKAGAAAGGGTPAAAPPSGDSPKPHGDKMEHAVREAASAPPKDKG